MGDPVRFHAVVVFGLGKNLLFKSALGHCAMWCLKWKKYDVKYRERRIEIFVMFLCQPIVNRPARGVMSRVKRLHFYVCSRQCGQDIFEVSFTFYVNLSSKKLGY